MAYRFVSPREDVGPGLSPADGAVYSFFDVGTSTPKTVYGDFTLATGIGTTVTADGNGVFPDIFLDASADVSLHDKNGVLIWGPETVYPPIDTFNSAAIAQTLDSLKRTAGEINAGVTPTNYSYPPGDARRYGAVFDGTTDDTAAHQIVLDLLASQGGGVWIIEGGISRAQGLVCRSSYVEISGSGWIKPVSDTATSIIKFGDLATTTTVQQVKGHIRVGDQSATFSTWPNIVGIKMERAVECDLRIDAPGLGVGLDLAGSGTGISYCAFHLGDMTNCKVSVRINPQSGGWCNENLFFGGRFAINSNTWESGVCGIQILNGAGATANGNIFYKPSFEGDGRAIDFSDATNNHIRNARWEGPSSGTEDVDFDSVAFKVGSDCNYNTVHITQGFDWLTSDTKDHGAADSRNSNGSFTFNGVDLTSYFFRGAPVKVTVGGTTSTTYVTRSLFSGGNTRVYVAHAWILSTAPTAVVTARVQDEGDTEWIAATVNSLGSAASFQGGMKVTNLKSGADLRSHKVLSAMGSAFPALLYSVGDSADTDNFFEVRDAAAAETAALDGRGHLNATGFRLGAGSTSARLNHVDGPTGGATVDAEARSAINLILFTLETFGFHETS